MTSIDRVEARLLRIIHTQNEIASSDLDLDAVMQVAADRALELTDAQAAVIAAPDPDRPVFQVTAGDADCARTPGVGRAESLAGRALRERRVITSDDCANDPRMVEPLRGESNTGSVICVPLLHRGTTIGVLSVCHTEPHQFGAGDAQTLELLSYLIAAQLSHAVRLAEESHDSRHDSLTDLPNRRAYEERLCNELARVDRQSHPPALCLIDLDGFKSINDDLGHPAGDRILRAVATAIRATREADEGFRIGGDEFAILLPKTSARAAIGRVQRMIDELSGVEIEGLDRIGVSYGIAAGEREADTLHAAADRELMAAKATLYGRVEHPSLAA